MSHAHAKTSSRLFGARQQQFKYAATGIAAALAAGAMAGLIISALASGPTRLWSPQQNELVDGWMPAAAGVAAAAEADRLAGLQDRYLGGLVDARSDGDLVDGYLPGLTPAVGTDDLVDGWIAGFPNPQDSADIQDGWESAIVR